MENADRKRVVVLLCNTNLKCIRINCCGTKRMQINHLDVNLFSGLAAASSGVLHFYFLCTHKTFAIRLFIFFQIFFFIFSFHAFIYLFTNYVILSLLFVYNVQCSFYSRLFFIISTFLWFRFVTVISFLSLLLFFSTSCCISIFCLVSCLFFLLFCSSILTPSSSSFMIFRLVSVLFLPSRTQHPSSKIRNTLQLLSLSADCRVFCSSTRVTHGSITEIPFLKYRFGNKKSHVGFTVEEVAMGIVLRRAARPFPFISDFTGADH